MSPSEADPHFMSTPAFAPARETIDAQRDRAVLRRMLDDALEKEIDLKTQLEFFSADDPRGKGRRIGALIYWRIAIMHIKRRLGELNREAREALTGATE